MASGVKAVHFDIEGPEWTSMDFSGIEVSIKPRIQSMDEYESPRAYYKAQLLKLQDAFPTMSLQDMAYRIARSVTWCHEVMREALAERQAEDLSWLAESM